MRAPRQEEVGLAEVEVARRRGGPKSGCPACCGTAGSDRRGGCCAPPAPPCHHAGSAPALGSGRHRRDRAPQPTHHTSPARRSGMRPPRKLGASDRTM